jgi:hypothetical protein
VKCPTCQTQMKPLFTGEFCPNDCDRGAWDPKPCTRFKSVSFASLRDQLITGSMFFYAPKRDITFMTILVEPKPMEAPKGMIFRMDISYDFKGKTDDGEAGPGPRDAGDRGVSGSVGRIFPKRRIRGDVR